VWHWAACLLITVSLFKNTIITQTFAEILLLIPTALTTGFVMFLPSVIQKIMNELKEAEFKRFLTLLTKYALKSPYAITVSTITFVGMFPYWIYYGFSNWWFSAGLIIWTITSVISKYTTLPIYSRVTGRKFPGYRRFPEIAVKDVKRLKEECFKLQTANILRATLSSISVVLMIIGFF
jgi:hypothetical protein